MTLIGAFAVNDYPIVFGDALVSSKLSVSSKGVSSLPSTGKKIQNMGRQSGIQVTNLCQKVNIMGPNLIAAWAGSYVHARVIFRELEEIASSSFRTADIEKTLDGIPSEDADKVAIILSFVDDGHYRILYRNADLYDAHPWIKPLVLQGSGQARAKYLFDTLPDLRGTNPQDAPYFHTIGTCLTIMAETYGAEITHGAGIGQGWGGAFEAAIQTDAGPQKLNKILFLSFLVRSNDRGNIDIVLVGRIIKTEYLGNDLVLRCITIKGEPYGTKLEIAEDEYFQVSPILSAARPIQTGIKLDYKYLCTRIFDMRENIKPQSFPLIDFCGDNHVPIKFVESNGVLEFVANDRFLERVKNGLRGATPKSA